MVQDLLALASDSIQRLQGASGPGARPQLLAWSGAQALLRESQGTRVATAPTGPFDLAPLIDHTLLRADATQDGIARLCEEARRFGFASVCVNTLWVPFCAELLQGSPVRVCTVVGFPLGASLAAIKAQEAQMAHGAGAQEIDMVLALGLVKSGDWAGVQADLRAVRQAVPGACVKLILETCLLTEDEKRRACKLAVQEGLDFVKTSTGFSTGGATVADIQLMRETVGTRVGVKASGGVRTYADALRMVQAGATRLGLSSSLAVIQAAEPSAPSEY